MKELVIISGKGGTGKTSITAALAALAPQVVLADCDVDAADLHLVLSPRILQRKEFSGGQRARIKAGHCTACGKCEELCRFDAIRFDGPGNGKVTKTFRVDPIACEGCGVCAWFCAEKAIEFGPVLNGWWYLSETKYGPLVHARLDVAAGNSGKLVTLVRKEARALAEKQGRQWLLVDGPPGIGCPVIASVTGADAVLVVTEPTLSGRHDLERVMTLTKHFGVPVFVCLNKYDINPAQAGEMEQAAAQAGAVVAGRIPYDRAITDAQLKGRNVIEHGPGPAAEAIRQVWACIAKSLL
jgi:MinD superfamily P-loop ATPase